MSEPRRDKDGFLANGPRRLRAGIEEEKRVKLKAIAEKLSREQDPAGKLVSGSGTRLGVSIWTKT